MTTAEIAEAAGVSKRTIFKVFPDKATLIYEAVKTILDPAPTRDSLQKIDASAPLDAQLVAAGQILLERLDRATALVEVLRSMPDSGKGRSADARRFVIASNAAITEALTELMEPHSEDLGAGYPRLTRPKNWRSTIRDVADMAVTPERFTEHVLSAWRATEGTRIEEWTRLTLEFLYGP